MEFNWSLTVALILLIALVYVATLLVRAWKDRKPSQQITIHSSIEDMRSIGELAVYKVFTKEIVTETDHSWGQFGERYLSWVLTQKKMAMVFEFEIEFRYNLRNNAFQIEQRGQGAYNIKMPPCQHEVFIRNITVYDEQKARVLPWLLPDLLNGFFSGSFDEQDKNHLIAAARQHAEERAKDQIKKLEGDLHASAESTLRSIARAFGADNVTIEFKTDHEPAMVIEMTKRLAA
jgi:Protein of unknown function (DUF4230)